MSSRTPRNQIWAPVHIMRKKGGRDTGLARYEQSAAVGSLAVGGAEPGRGRGDAARRKGRPIGCGRGGGAAVWASHLAS